LSEEFESFEEVDRQIRSKRPDIEALWDKSKQKRGFSEFLLRARYRAGLSQSQLAERAGWDKSFVSRMESAFSPIPDLLTISRYMSACGETVGLTVFNTANPEDLSIVDALVLNPANAESVVQREARVETSG
jgi:transcriptional regulator with XRE-family HTH domain